MAPSFLSEVNWKDVFRFSLNPNYGTGRGKDPRGLKRFVLGNDFDVLLAESYEAAEVAVSEIVAESIETNHGVFGLDMEWKPCEVGDFSDVAMLQLSAGCKVALLRTCRFDCALPDQLMYDVFDCDEAIVATAGFDSGDAKKLLDSFGLDCKTFSCQKRDIQHLAKDLGFTTIGLKSLTQKLLDPSYVKPETERRCDWEAKELPRSSLKYAALDAVCTEAVYWKLTDMAVEKASGTDISAAVAEADSKEVPDGGDDDTCSPVKALSNYAWENRE